MDVESKETIEAAIDRLQAVVVTPALSTITEQLAGTVATLHSEREAIQKFVHDEIQGLKDWINSRVVQLTITGK